MAKKKFQYVQWTSSYDPNLYNMTAALNELGSDGWELLALKETDSPLHKFVLIFKRCYKGVPKKPPHTCFEIWIERQKVKLGREWWPDRVEAVHL